MKNAAREKKLDTRQQTKIEFNRAGQTTIKLAGQQYIGVDVDN